MQTRAAKHSQLLGPSQSEPPSKHRKTGSSGKSRRTTITSSFHDRKYVVDRILAYRDVNGQRQYQVKWAGCGVGSAMWEDEERLLEDCETIVDHFLNSVLTGQDVKETYLYTVDFPNAVVRECSLEIDDEMEYICNEKRFLRVYKSLESKVAVFVRLYDKERLIPANSCSKDHLHLSRGVQCHEIIPDLSGEYPVSERLKRIVSILSSSTFYVLGEKELELACVSKDTIKSNVISVPKARMGEFVTNGILKTQIDLVVSEFLEQGFVVQGSSSNYYTRFASSQPDLAIYKALSDSVYGIAGYLAEPVVGFVAESQLGASKEVNKDYQMCAEMITLAGELVVQQLARGLLVSCQASL